VAVSSRLEALAVSALAGRDQALAALDGGDAAGAATAARAALDMLDSAGLGDGLDAAAVLIALAEIDEVLGGFAAGRFEDAAAYRRAMAAAEEDGADPLVVAGLLHNLGGLAHARGCPEEGIGPAEAGLELRIAALGQDHPDTGRDLNALGALYEFADRPRDAADAYRKALAIFEACYGPGHFEVAMVHANLAVLAAGQGDNAEAERLGRQSLAVFQELLGPDDAEVGLTLLNLGAAVAGQGRPDEALALLARAQAILVGRLPAGHPPGPGRAGRRRYRLAVPPRFLRGRLRPRRRHVPRLHPRTGRDAGPSRPWRPSRWQRSPQRTSPGLGQGPGRPPSGTWTYSRTRPSGASGR
jgi:tetratricopeptide (TPR) repeat protein